MEWINEGKNTEHATSNDANTSIHADRDKTITYDSTIHLVTKGFKKREKNEIDPPVSIYWDVMKWQ